MVLRNLSLSQTTPLPCTRKLYNPNIFCPPRCHSGHVPQAHVHAGGGKLIEKEVSKIVVAYFNKKNTMKVRFTSNMLGQIMRRSQKKVPG